MTTLDAIFTLISQDSESWVALQSAILQDKAHLEEMSCFTISWKNIPWKYLS